MAVKFNAWLNFFRLPNLPTAPGDALAGASVVLAGACSGVSHFGGEDAVVLVLKAVFAGCSALFLYMFGLADNDITGKDADALNSKPRPLVTGEISLNAACAARAICVFLAVVCGFAGRLPLCWWLTSALLVLCIALYNRYKESCRTWGIFSMGLCRGLSLISGGAAVSQAAGAGPHTFAALFVCAAGWVAYISAVTYISLNENDLSKPFSRCGKALGIVSFAPLLSFLFIGGVQRSSVFLSLLCCTFAFVLWQFALSVPGIEEDLAKRRSAVGALIKALLYIQVGFILLFPHTYLVFISAVLFVFSILVRRFRPEICGS